MSLDQAILQNLLVEREMAIAKLLFTQTRLDGLDARIAELRARIEAKYEPVVTGKELAAGVES